MNEPRGWVFYDGSCPVCRGSAARFERILFSPGYGLAPLQTPWAQRRIGVNGDALLEEMRVLTHDNRILGGVDALIYLAGQIGWAWPLSMMARIAPIRSFLWILYRWVARHRYCLSGACAIQEPLPRHPPLARWAALVALAVGGSLIYGSALALRFPQWPLGRGALWITLSAGLSWCIFIPVLARISRQDFFAVLYVCLVTMAYGEAVLLTAGVLNALAYFGTVVLPAGRFNLMAIAISNIVMAGVLAKQLKARGISIFKTILLWIIVLDGSGAAFFWLFSRWLFGGTL